MYIGGCFQLHMRSLVHKRVLRGLFCLHHMKLKFDPEIKYDANTMFDKVGLKVTGKRMDKQTH